LTSGLARGSRLIVVAVDVDGTEVVRLALGHGDDPTRLLGLQGWDVRRVKDVVRHPVQSQVLTMTFLVEPSIPGRHEEVADPLHLVNPVDPVDPVDPIDPIDPVDPVDQGAAEGEVPVRHQRVAAYALVTSTRGLLMTQFSDQTNAEGQWGLPGGGLEVGEAPERAVVREVWEESGQAIWVNEIALVRTSRWIGRAPSGQLEDFHAVRVVYRAVCPEPTEPVVHDVGGTTASAAWLPASALDELALTSGWRSILRDVAEPGLRRSGTSDVIMTPDQPDGADNHHQDPDGDERTGTQPRPVDSEVHRLRGDDQAGQNQGNESENDR